MFEINRLAGASKKQPEKENESTHLALLGKPGSLPRAALLCGEAGGTFSLQAAAGARRSSVGLVVPVGPVDPAGLIVALVSTLFAVGRSQGRSAVVVVLHMKTHRASVMKAGKEKKGWVSGIS